MKNKILSFFFILSCLMFSVNAVTLNYDQNENVYEIENGEIGNKIYTTVAGNINNAYTIDNTTYTYDYKLELSEVSEDFYLAIENYYIGANYTIFFHGDLTKDGTLYVQQLQFNEQGEYYLKFSPSGIEPVQVYIGVQDDSHIFDVSYSEQKPKGFNSLIGGFVDAFSKVFDLNVKLWYLLYYLIIISITLGFLAILFGTAFYLFKASKKVKEKETIFNFQNEQPRERKRDREED